MLVVQARGLTISYGGAIALRQVHCQVRSGEILGINGPSGSGKSTLLGALHGHLPRGARQEAGSVERFATTAYIEQEARMAFSPYLRIGEQLAHSKHKAVASIESALERVGLAEARRIARAYPHEVSGGELQRAAWAQALLAAPAAILADEPTTALDSVAQRALVEMAVRLCREAGLALVWVSHHRPLLAAISDRFLTLERGTAPAEEPSRC